MRLAWACLGLLMALLPVKAAVVGTNQVVNVTVTWDKSIDPSVTGYKVYYGTNAGVWPFTVNSGTNIVCTVSNLVANTIYFFVVTAYNAQAVESLPSNEVGYKPFNMPPTNAPTNLRVTFQMQASTHPGTNFQNLAGATITITNQVDPLIPGWFYKTLIVATPIPP